MFKNIHFLKSLNLILMTRNLTVVLTSILLMLTFTSCHKNVSEPASSSPGLTGDWKLISVEGRNDKLEEVNNGVNVLKKVSAIPFSTREINSGYVTIDETIMTLHNVSYTINGAAQYSIYKDGALTDSQNLPYQFTPYPISISTTYKKIGVDSIYFQTGTGFIGGLSASTDPGGAKVKMENDELSIVQSVKQSFEDTAQGVLTTSTINGTFIIKLRRQ